MMNEKNCDSCFVYRETNWHGIATYCYIYCEKIRDI